MQKLTLESIIEKYYLNGLVETIKWEIRNKEMTIKFNPEQMRSVVGTIKYKNIDLLDNDILIFDTSQLLKLVKILGQEIYLDVLIEYKVPTKLLLSDNEFDLEFYLADKNLVNNKIPTIAEQTYSAEFKITSEFINKFKSAKKGLGSDINKFIIEHDGMFANSLSFIIGDLNNHSNKVRFTTEAVITENISALPFNSNVFNEILLANESAENGKFQINKEGLIKLSFTEKDIESTYYLVRLDEES